MSRVVSELSIIASHHKAARLRAPAAETKQPAGPFSSLLDSEAAPRARDHADPQPQPAKRVASTSSHEMRPDKSPAGPDRSNRTEREATPPDDASPGDADAELKGAPKGQSADGCKDAEAADAGKPADAAETAQVLPADILPAARTEPPQQSPRQPDLAPVTLPTPALAAAIAAPQAATDATNATSAVTAGAPDLAEASPNAGRTPTDAARAGSAPGQTGLNLDSTIAVEPRPTSKSDATAATTPAAQPVQMRGQDPAQAAATTEPKPEHAERHAAQAGPTDAPAQKSGDAAPRTHADGQTAATFDAVKPAVDTAPQLAGAPQATIHVANPASAPAAAPTHASPAAADAGAAPVPIAGLAVEITARVQSGRNRFEIRLDPPELGRVDVRLDVDRAGNVTSRLVVEKAETLDLLRRDAPQLERALNDAGLKTGDNGLQFALRDQSFAGRHEERTAPAMARVIVPDPDMAPIDVVASSYGRLPRAGGGIDIQV